MPSLYALTIPVFRHTLDVLDSLLAKGEADAAARGYAPDILLAARLAPDMYPLVKQVQIVSDLIKNGAARLAGLPLPSFPDTEATMAELHERVRKTRNFLTPLTETGFATSASPDITLKFPQGEMTFAPDAYVSGFLLPNVYFHMTTTYALLRHNGVKLGKMDFMRPTPPA